MSTNENRSERLELLIVGRILLTIGVASLTVGAAITAALVENVGAIERTLAGLGIAAAMIGIGELLSRRSDKNFLFWLSTNLMSAGYALAYFFVYSLYYVPGLTVLETPYLSWVLGPALAALATFHGARNKNMRWVAPVFTLLITGHASYHVLSSVAVITLFGVSVKVAALGCFFGMAWCGALSAVYKRLELRYTWGTTVSDSADWLFNRAAHEVYFIAAALNAMALPLFLTDLAQAPLWWSLEAPLLLALSWKGANYFKHGVVGVIWAAAVALLVNSALHGAVALPVLISVPLAGVACGLAYRFLKGTMVPSLRVNGYCLYVYAAVVVALLVPYVQCGNIWDAMPFWMVEALVICGAGIALRDRIVHEVGQYAALAALVLFGLQFNTWTWGLVGPVVACAYGLSVAYGYIRKKGGWAQTDFLPQESIFGNKWAVTAERASNLDLLWSWVGAGVLIAASLILRNAQEAVLWWSAEALLLTGLSVLARSERYRYQAYLGFALAGLKLAVWDVCGGSLGYTAVAAFTLYRALEFAIYGASSVAGSYLCHREEARLTAESTSDEAAPKDDDTTK